MYKEPKCLLLSIIQTRFPETHREDSVQKWNLNWNKNKDNTCESGFSRVLSPTEPWFHLYTKSKSFLPNLLSVQLHDLRKNENWKTQIFTSQIKQTTSHYFCACSLPWVDWKPISHENSFGIKFKIAAVLVAISGNVWAVPMQQPDLYPGNRILLKSTSQARELEDSE